MITENNNNNNNNNHHQNYILGGCLAFVFAFIVGICLLLFLLFSNRPIHVHPKIDVHSEPPKVDVHLFPKPSTVYCYKCTNCNEQFCFNRRLPLARLQHRCPNCKKLTLVLIENKEEEEE